MSEIGFHYLFKYVIIGDSNVGKSCILSRINENKFRNHHEVTLGVDLGMKILTIDGKIVKVRIWDTAGQENFRSITRSYYRGAIGILLVYDITNRKSFESVKSWLNEIEKYGNEKVKIILVGNKSDAVDHRQVDQREGIELALEIQSLFIEVSALEGTNILECFETLTSDVLFLVKSNQIDLNNKNCGVQVQATKAEEQCPC